MTEKKSIIDGVDVLKEKINMCFILLLHKIDILETIEQTIYEHLDVFVEEWNKQLEQKKQECEKLKEENFTFEQLIKEYEKYGAIEEIIQQLNQLKTENEILKKKLEQIRDIAEPYKMTIKKICKNCEKYDSCHACCYKDISCYKYTSPNAKSCDEFTYLDKLIPNIISNHILQIIDGEDNEKNS